jgi:hypothetical protein
LKINEEYICQLADEAFYASDISADGLHSASNEFCVKFAELIIADCISACATDDLGKTKSAEELIRDHFAE